MKLSESPKREALRERACFIYPQSKIPECPGYREVRGASSALRQHSGFLCLEGTMSEIPKGFCQCGCGGKTSLATQTHRKYGYIKDEPVRYILGHFRHHRYFVRCSLKGTENPSWKGGRTLSRGYVRIWKPGHPRAHNNYVYEHILIAEKALGKPLPLRAEVHHVNGVTGDNEPGNHVICQDHAYHVLIEQRTRAYNACGHAKWLRCRFCGKHDDPANLYLIPNHNYGYHRHCQTIDQRNKRRTKSELKKAQNK